MQIKCWYYKYRHHETHFYLKIHPYHINYNIIGILFCGKCDSIRVNVYNTKKRKLNALLK